MDRCPTRLDHVGRRKGRIMERVTIAVVLAIAAIVAIATQAPPKVYQNVTTYYKKLIKAPAAQVTAFSSRARPRVTPRQPVSKPVTKSPSSAGPNITVLGDISWERDAHASRAKATPRVPGNEGPPEAQEAPLSATPEIPTAETPLAADTEGPLSQTP